MKEFYATISAAFALVGFLDLLVGLILARRYNQAKKILDTLPCPDWQGNDPAGWRDQHERVDFFRVGRFVCVNTGASFILIGLFVVGGLL